MNRDQSSGGTCTYVIQLASGQYVTEPECTVGGCPGCRSFDINAAYLDENKARNHADTTPWIGKSASIQRARP